MTGVFPHPVPGRSGRRRPRRIYERVTGRAPRSSSLVPVLVRGGSLSTGGPETWNSLSESRTGALHTRPYTRRSCTSDFTPGFHVAQYVRLHTPMLLQSERTRLLCPVHLYCVPPTYGTCAPYFVRTRGCGYDVPTSRRSYTDTLRLGLGR